jgi:iron complex outermembrane receptor protein
MSRHFCTPLFAALLAAPAVCVTPAHAESLQSFDIPAQPLATALTEYGRQAGMQIFFPRSAIGVARTGAIKGSMTRQAALQKLLAGSSLQVRSDDGKTIVLGMQSGSPAGVQVTESDEPPESDDPRQGEILVVAEAIRVSPSNMPLDVIQPTSEIDKNFIKNNIIPLASFDDVIKFAPSVFAQSPNGPGLGKNETLSLRGFQDGQFNVTFDGIPFGDATDLHHTTSALFIAHDLLDAEIDRGPGTGSTIGNATFGGTIGFRTKDPLDSFTVNPYLTAGSFGTWSIGGELDTGDTRFGKAFIDVQHEQSNGYLSYAKEKRTNVQAKTVTQITPDVKLTLLASWNHAFEYTTQGTTLANMEKYGADYALSNDPKNQNYYKYQPSDYGSDFEYARLQANLGRGWTVDDTLYTTSFTHNYTESKDGSDNDPADNGVTYYDDNGNKLKPQPVSAATDISGKVTRTHFRSYGNVLRVADEISNIGTLRFGLWSERTDDRRVSYTNVLTQGGELLNSKYGTPYTYNIKDHLTTLQPYVEFAWKPLAGLTITPGVRYSSFDRSVDAPLNKVKPPVPLHYSETFAAWQPSVAANYVIRPGWTAYAQVAKGFLAPPIDTFEVGAIEKVKPETTTNYQIGTAGHFGRLVLSADAYYINFSNYITTVNVNDPDLGVVSTYANGPGAIYKGAELEAQYVLGKGFSLYGNATFNSAKYKHSNVWLADAPRWTAAAGLLYDAHKGPYFSVIAKWIGPRYGLDTNGVDDDGKPVFFNDPTTHLGAFVTADLAAGWHFDKLLDLKKDTTLSVKVSNVFNSHRIDGYAGAQSATNEPLYWTVPGRAAFVNLSVSM